MHTAPPSCLRCGTLNPRKAYLRCALELERLQSIAFHQLFSSNKMMFFYDPDLDQAISYFGIVQKISEDENGNIIYHFSHKAYPEYFSALFLVGKLLSEHEQERAYAVDIIVKHRYEPHYSEVWQFMAGMVSFGDANYIKKNPKQALKIFWKAIVSEPADVVGIAHNQLLEDCLKNSDWSVMTKLSFYEKIAFIRGKLQAHEHDLVLESSSKPDAKEDKEADEAEKEPPISLVKSIEELNTYLDENKTIKTSFKGKGYVLSEIAAKIEALSHSAKTEKEKEECIHYLTEEIKDKIPPNCFKISSAISKALVSLHIDPPEVQKALRVRLKDLSNRARLTAAQGLLELGCSLDQEILEVLVCASHDTYQTRKTWLAYESLEVLAKTRPNDEAVIRQLFTYIASAQDSGLLRALFECLSNSKEFVILIQELFFETPLNKSFHTYGYLMLCRLGQNYFKQTLECIFKNNEVSLISELPYLLNSAPSSQENLRNALDLIKRSALNSEGLTVLSKLLQTRLIQIGDVADIIIKMLDNKNVTAEAAQLLTSYGYFNEKVVCALTGLNSSGGFWLVDGGLPAIAKLHNYFDKNLADFLVKIIQEKYDAYSVSTVLNATLIELAESGFRDEYSTILYLQVICAYAEKTYLRSKDPVSSWQTDRLFTSLVNNNIPISTLIEAFWKNYQLDENEINLFLLLEVVIRKNLAFVVSEGRANIVGSNINLFLEMNRVQLTKVRDTLAELIGKFIEQRKLTKKIEIDLSDSDDVLEEVPIVDKLLNLRIEEKPSQGLYWLSTANKEAEIKSSNPDNDVALSEISEKTRGYKRKYEPQPSGT